MTRERIAFNPPDLSPQCQEHPSLISPAERVARPHVSATIPSISIEESPSERVLEPKVKPNAIERVLARLSVLELPAKDYVEDYLRHLHRRNCKFTTLSSRLTALQL